MKEEKTKKYRVNKKFNTNDYYDFYLSLKTNNSPVLHKETYRKAITRVNNIIYKELVTNLNRIELPYNMGTIELSQRLFKLIVRDDKIVNKHLAVDCKKTRLLRLENEDAVKNNLKIYRDEQLKRLFILWRRKGYTFRNKKYFIFHILRTPYRKINDLYRNGDFYVPTQYGTEKKYRYE